MQQLDTNLSDDDKELLNFLNVSYCNLRLFVYLFYYFTYLFTYY